MKWCNHYRRSLFLYLYFFQKFATSPLKSLDRIQRNLTRSKITVSSTKFVFLGRSENQDDRPSLWFAETFSTSHLKLVNGIQRNFTGSKFSTSSAKFVCVCVGGGGGVRADRKTKTAAQASDWLRHFRLLLCNCRTEFNETWQEARSQRPLSSLRSMGRSKTKMTAPAYDWPRYQCPLPNLCFSGRLENQADHRGLWLTDQYIFDLSSETTEWNLTNKNTTFGLISKQKWPPWPIHKKVEQYSGVRYVALCAPVCGKVFNLPSFFVIFMQWKWLQDCWWYFLYHQLGCVRFKPRP